MAEAPPLEPLEQPVPVPSPADVDDSEVARRQAPSSDAFDLVEHKNRLRANLELSRAAAGPRSAGTSDWAGLPEDMLCYIFDFIHTAHEDGRSVLRLAGRVCRSWRVAVLETLMRDTAISRPKTWPFAALDGAEGAAGQATSSRDTAVCRLGEADEQSDEEGGAEACSKKRAVPDKAELSAGEEREGVGRPSRHRRGTKRKLRARAAERVQGPPSPAFATVGGGVGGAEASDGEAVMMVEEPEEVVQREGWRDRVRAMCAAAGAAAAAAMGPRRAGSLGGA